MEDLKWWEEEVGMSAKDALKKQEPEKVTSKCECPICGAKVRKEYHFKCNYEKYCSKCGQKLDWD